MSSPTYSGPKPKLGAEVEVTHPDGSKATGTVIQVNPDAVMVDFPVPSEGPKPHPVFAFPAAKQSEKKDPDPNDPKK